MRACAERAYLLIDLHGQVDVVGESAQEVVWPLRPFWWMGLNAISMSVAAGVVCACPVVTSSTRALQVCVCRGWYHERVSGPVLLGQYESEPSQHSFPNR